MILPPLPPPFAAAPTANRVLFLDASRRIGQSAALTFDGTTFGAPAISASGNVTGANLSGTNTGDQTITLTGDVSGSGTGSFATTIGANKVTLAQMAQVATASFLGRTTAGTGNVEALTVTQATALLNVFSGTLKGLAPSSGGGSSTFLRADGAWAVPPGTGGAGTVTQVSTDATLTGGPITSTGTLGLNLGNANVWTGAQTFPNSSGIKIKDTDGSNTLGFAGGSNLTADRTLTITTGDANRTLTFTADASIGGTTSGTNTGDQTITLTGDVTGTGTGSFAATVAKIAGTTVSGTTGSGNVVFATAPTVAGGSFTGLTGLAVRSTGTGAFDLTIANTENLTAGRTLTIAVNNAARTLTVSGNATVSGTNTGDGVSSVAMTVPSWLTVAGSPITTTGTLAVTAATGQTANQVLATPNGSTGAVALRALAAADLPAINLGNTAVTGVLTDDKGGTGSNLSATGPGVVVQASAGASLTVASGILGPNAIDNGGAEVWQRGTSLSGLADVTYCADRWYVLTQTGTIAAAQATGTLGARYALQLTQSQASAQRMGVAQVIEASNSIPYRGRAVQLQIQVKASTATNIRFAIVEWTGTADSVTKDVVNDWTSGTYTAGNFFTSTSTTVTQVSGSKGATTSFQQFTITGTPSASCNNLIVFVWTEATAAQNVTLTVTEIALYDGTLLQPWLPRPLAAELALCQRYFLAVSSQPMGLAIDAANLYSWGVYEWLSEMRVAPTLSNATYTATAGNPGVVSMAGTTTKGARFSNSSANWTVGAGISMTAQLSADL